MPVATGTTLQSRYRVVATLGQGGMGAVYRAWDRRLKKPVALKEMAPQPGLDSQTLAQFRTQFEQEAVVLGKLKHPYLVPVTDYFEERGNDYLVMEFVEGESLAERIKREGGLPEAQVVAWASQLLDALAYCHESGVIHRDIKPQNVIVSPRGEAPKGSAVLVDFGLAKLWDPADPQTRTVMRGMGTPEYAPPEQWGTEGYHTDPRSDLYSLGATLYHALTGQAPPTASDRMVYPKRYRTPRELNARVSPHVDAVISRAMTLAIDERWASASVMGEGLVSRVTLPGDAAPLPPDSVAPGPLPMETRPMPQTPGPQEGLVPSEGRVAMPERQRTGEGQQEPAPPKTFARENASVRTAAAAGRRGGVSWWVWALGAVVVVALAVAGVLSSRNTGDAVRPTATPEPGAWGAGDVATRTIDGATMVYVPAGRFAMGSTDGAADEAPVHQVRVGAFWLDQTEVTNAQYGKCVAAGECARSEHADDADLSGDTYPVVGVSWDDAAAYCAWAGGRLPTEAEWEYAAGGPENRVYPWGDRPREGYANCYGEECADGYAYAAAAGSIPDGASWVGALDMAGNAMEWVNDWYSESTYSRSPSANPSGPASGETRVLRGGSWYDDWDLVRVAARYYEDPTQRHDHFGFRCAGAVVEP